MWRADSLDGVHHASDGAQRLGRRLPDRRHTGGPLAISPRLRAVSRRADNRRRWARSGDRVREGQELTVWPLRSQYKGQQHLRSLHVGPVAIRKLLDQPFFFAPRTADEI